MLITLMKDYFLYFIKPTSMVFSFTCNLFYMLYSDFFNNSLLIIYITFFSIKPFFYLCLLIGVIVTYKLSSVSELLAAIIVIASIFFGFPIKELSDKFQFKSYYSFFQGRQYELGEYIKSHSVVNVLIENLPMLLCSTLNNYFLLQSKYTQVIIFNEPILSNIGAILISGVFMCIVNFRKEIY